MFNKIIHINNFEVINNNLDRVFEIIKEDFKQTKEINKKEVEEYRKRVANRGRIIGKKEFGDRFLMVYNDDTDWKIKIQIFIEEHKNKKTIL